MSDPLFTLELFRRAFRDQSFHGLVNHAAVLDLSQIPSDEIKNTLAQLVVLSSHAYYNAQPHSGTIRQFLAFDEGHRVLTSDYMLRLVRECRAYGVGTILSSQYSSGLQASPEEPQPERLRRAVCQVDQVGVPEQDAVLLRSGTAAGHP